MRRAVARTPCATAQVQRSARTEVEAVEEAAVGVAMEATLAEPTMGVPALATEHSTL
jgi:hypothetical protein